MKSPDVRAADARIAAVELGRVAELATRAVQRIASTRDAEDAEDAELVANHTEQLTQLAAYAKLLSLASNYRATRLGLLADERTTSLSRVIDEIAWPSTTRRPTSD
ncbi:MAG: hypothetical protein H0T89_00965 [Deltaproteobacteria bacterium]|nr:hypothetical protein [Deltaproteobacteria bacterium]